MEYIFVKGYTKDEIIRICERLIGRTPKNVKFQHAPDIGKRIIIEFEPELTTDECKTLDSHFSRMGYILLE